MGNSKRQRIASGSDFLSMASDSIAGAATVAMLASILAGYSLLPINKEIKPIDVVSETWKNRPKANMVKWLMQRSSTTLETLAVYLDCSVNYLNNKLTRDSFSFDDLLIVAYACGYTFVLANNNEIVKSDNSYRIDLVKYFRDSDKETLERISKIEEEKKKAKHDEYKKKKEELEHMKIEYGFED